MMLTVLLWNLQDCHRYESSIYARLVLVLRALELRFGPVGGPSVRQKSDLLRPSSLPLRSTSWTMGFRENSD